ncbi:hypothetical protein [Actinoplanes siamensis]|uniref:Uncharacterized protein n=1 Tax=Actinoplanes siamensis TaxID=1223317 RepID=A0A919NDF9_9ACTN|nr:hypothetical protein [Actinoplanes siamensis]GIF08883.1 hypothetical protein Asi03nite_64210 [Actinoplanes siamensis]
MHEADQAQAAAEAGRVDELHAVVRAARRRVARAQRRLDYVRGWQARVTGVFEALPRLTKTGSRGKLELKEGPGREARAVWLIADFCARMQAERAARGVSGRGRPPQHPLVVGVMAIAADPAAGRRSMEGLGWTALYAGVTTRTVSSSRAYSASVGATVEVERGRTCSLAEREETGLRRRRSVWDFEPLHTSPFDPEPFLGAAAAVVARLLERAVQLVDERQAVLEEQRAAVAAAEARLLDAQATVAERRREVLLLEAELDETRAGEAAVAAREARALRSRATLAVAPRLCAPVPATVAADRAVQAERDRATATVAAAYDAATRMDSFFHPPRSGLGKRFSSASRGLTQSLGFSPLRAGSTPVAGGRRPDGRGAEHNGGASRPSPTKRVSGRTSPQRPRMPEGQGCGSPAVSARSATMLWAKPLARGLAARWEFLARFLDDAADGRRTAREVARERGLRLMMIASTLGSRLSRYWTVGEVVRLVQDHGLAHRFGPRHVIAAGDAHSPLTYLATVLDRALTSDAAVVPQPSPVRAAWIAEQAAANAAAIAAVRQQRDAAAAGRAAGYAVEQQGPGTARAAAFAAARAARGPAPRPYVPPVDDPARLAAAAAELAVHRGAGPAEDDAVAWPAPAQPGGGVPYGRKEPGAR